MGEIFYFLPERKGLRYILLIKWNVIFMLRSAMFSIIVNALKCRITKNSDISAYANSVYSDQTAPEGAV